MGLLLIVGWWLLVAGVCLLVFLVVGLIACCVVCDWFDFRLRFAMLWVVVLRVIGCGFAFVRLCLFVLLIVVCVWVLV